MSVLFCPLNLMLHTLNFTSIFFPIRNISFLLSNKNMDLIYHVCDLRYSNSTNIIIGQNEKCLIPTNTCFWKDPSEIISFVRTRFQLKNEPVAHWTTIDNYFKQRINKIIN